MRRLSSQPVDPPADAAHVRAEADRAASEVQGSAARPTRSSVPRAECPDSCRVHAHTDGLNTHVDRNHANVAFPGLNGRSGESFRAEAAYAKVASKQKTKADRLVMAGVLLAVLTEHDVSRGRFAMMLGVNEKAVRKMLCAEVSIPLHAFLRMPTDMRRDFIEGVAEASGCDAFGVVERALSKIRAARDIAAAHALEDAARDLARELGRGR